MCNLAIVIVSSAPSTTVEIVGQWGSGKTTLATQLIERLKLSGFLCPGIEEIDRWRAIAGMSARGGRTMGRPERTMQLLSRVIGHPLVAATVASQAATNWRFAHKSPCGKGCGKGIVKYSLLMRSIESLNVYDTVVWDEGVVSAGLRHAIGVPRNRIVDAVVRSSSCRERSYVCLSVDLTTALSRWRERYPPGPRSTDSRTAVSKLRKYQAVYSSVVSSFQRAIPERTLVLTGEKPLPENVDAALQFVAARIKAARE